MLIKRKQLFLPPNLDIDHLNSIVATITNTEDQVKKEDQVKRVVHQISLLYTVLCQDLIYLNLNNNPNGYTHIHCNTLRTILGANYGKTLNMLLNANYLERETVNPYGKIKEKGYFSKVSKKSKSYRIPKHLRSDSALFKRIEIEPNDKVLMNKILTINKVCKDLKVQSEFYRNYILSSMGNMVLLDDETTRGLINDYCISRGISPSEGLTTAIIEKFNYSPINRAVICPFAGRLHAVLTTLIKSIRSRVRYTGYLNIPYVEIDIVASQPWFLSIISPKLIKRYVPECQDAIPYFEKAYNQADAIHFRELCGNSEYGIYDYLRDEYNNRHGECFTRDQAKKICYRAFFSNYTYKERLTIESCQNSIDNHVTLLANAKQEYNNALAEENQERVKIAEVALNTANKYLKKAISRLFTQKCYELFKDKFPSVHSLFFNIKKLKWDFERGAEPDERIKYYANNALLAQRLESNIVYTVVCKALIDNNITRIGTIHDSFMVPADQADKARRVIKKAFSSIGLKPNFK
ncbi:hypothetical protein [Hymenobacter sp. DG01]|uniref:hypothetical protein n=1 Tax=Hymenobacter sp. DG01 TaxID=2584940 RepID=UPI00112440CB|nr:hypothetical protein [Hymenobacter sp. DG01]